jgi:replicative DNA helicase
LEAVPLVPGALLAFKTEPGSEDIHGPDWIAVALHGVPEGLRNDTCARLAGYFVSLGMPDDVVVAVLETFASRCRPPFPLADVRRVVASIARAEAQKPAPESTNVHVSVGVAKLLDEIRNPRTGVATPFKALDSWITGGFQPGELIYLGARPGVGKTAMALEMARAAAKAGKQVLIVSREMLLAALTRRMISQEGMLSASLLKLGQVDLAEVCAVGAKISGLPIWINDSVRSLAEIEVALGSVVGGVDLLIVDYLQLVEAPRQVRERRLQVEHVSQGLKSLAMKHQVPVVCLSSLSRPPSGTNPEPTLASLRESGELEHDADIVIFLHRKHKDALETMCIVAKNRDGGTGAAELTFKPEFVSFAESESPF